MQKMSLFIPSALPLKEKHSVIEIGVQIEIVAHKYLH